MKSKFVTRTLATVALGAFCIGGTTVFAENVIKLLPEEIISIAPTVKETEQISNWEPIAPAIPITFDSQAGWDLQRPNLKLELLEQALFVTADVQPAQSAETAAVPAPQPSPAPAATPKAAIVNKAKAVTKPAAASKQAAASQTAPTADTQNKTVQDSNGKPVSYKKVIQAKASAYSSATEENGYYGAVDYFGNALKLGTIAVDPSVIPLGTTVLVRGHSFDGLPQTLMAKATDIGGAIKGNRIDIFIPGSRDYVKGFGIQNVEIYVLN